MLFSGAYVLWNDPLIVSCMGDKQASAAHVVVWGSVVGFVLAGYTLDESLGLSGVLSTQVGRVQTVDEVVTLEMNCWLW